MAYTRRTTASTSTYASKRAPLREELGGTSDQRLDRLTLEILKRMEQELDRYSVPQLLSGLHKVLQVQLIMQRLRSQGYSADVGSSVRKYSSNFAQANAGGRGTTNTRRRAAARADDDDVIDLVIASDDEC